MKVNLSFIICMIDSLNIDLFYHKCKVRQKIKDEYCIILIALDPERDSSVSLTGRIPLSSLSGL